MRAGGAGAISGHLSYPSSSSPTQLVYAVNVARGGGDAYAVQAVVDQLSYSIVGVPPGTYHVYASIRPVTSSPSTPGYLLGAGYTNFARCGGNGYGNHDLVDVTIGANTHATDIDPIDWYGIPAFAAPPMATIPPEAVAVSPTTSFSSAREAAIVFQSDEHTRAVNARSDCPTNLACSMLGDEHDGAGAAYFEATLISNDYTNRCGVYVFQVGSSWRFLHGLCAPRPFPAVSASGALYSRNPGDPTGCVNARAEPGPAGVVKACLAFGTKVIVDGGPNYVPMDGSDGLWWHVNQGWVADDFFTPLRMG